MQYDDFFIISKEEVSEQLENAKYLFAEISNYLSSK